MKTIEELKELTCYTSNIGTTIEEKASTKDLGVIMSSTADFKAQIDSIAETVKGLSSWILRSFKSRSRLVMLQLWKSIVIPRLDYCSQLWNPHQTSLINKMEDLQKAYIKKHSRFQAQILLGILKGAWTLLTPKEKRTLTANITVVNPGKYCTKHTIR